MEYEITAVPMDVPGGFVADIFTEAGRDTVRFLGLNSPALAVPNA